VAGAGLIAAARCTTPGSPRSALRLRSGQAGTRVSGRGRPLAARGRSGWKASRVTRKADPGVRCGASGV